MCLERSAAESQFDYFFTENGLVAYKEGQILAVQSLKKFLGDEKLKELINFILHYIADLDIPIKRGTFVEFRNGMLNVSPIGRNCSQEERDDFEQFDLKTGIRCAYLRTCSMVLMQKTESASSAWFFAYVGKLLSHHFAVRGSVLSSQPLLKMPSGLYWLGVSNEAQHEHPNVYPNQSTI